MTLVIAHPQRETCQASRENGYGNCTHMCFIDRVSVVLYKRAPATRLWNIARRQWTSATQRPPKSPQNTTNGQRRTSRSAAAQNDQWKWGWSGRRVSFRTFTDDTQTDNKSGGDIRGASKSYLTKHLETRMWANAQPDGRPAEHRWRPLFNAAKFDWRLLLDAVQ